MQKKKAKKGAKKRKKSTKKSSKSKVEVTIKRKVLGEAPKEFHFVLKTGEKLKSLQELADAMETMHEDVFKHHVNDTKNDFASWIEDVFEEKGFSKELRKAQNKIESRIKLLQKLVDEVIQEGKR